MKQIKKKQQRIHWNESFGVAFFFGQYFMFCKMKREREREQKMNLLNCCNADEDESGDPDKRRQFD